MSFKNLYAVSRPWHLTNPIDIDGKLLNEGYGTQFFNQGQFADFAAANIVTISSPIGNERYVGKIPVIDPVTELPTGEFRPKLSRLVRLRYSDLYTNATDLKNSIEKTGAHTGVETFATTEEVCAWIRSNTDLKEVAIGKFLIREAGKDAIGIEREAEYLTIE